MLALYLRAMSWLNQRKESGQTLVEYALIIVLIALVLIVALIAISGSISTAFANAQSGLT